MKPKELMMLIKTRRSIRVYRDKKVPKKVIKGIIEAGIWAPSAMNKQPWKFVVVTDRKKINELSEEVKKQALKSEWIMKIARFVERFTSPKDLVFYNAPVLIIITGKKGDKWNKYDTALAAQNMMLYAHSLGLGSCWIGFGNELNKSPNTKKELGIAKNNEILACLIFGYPDEKHSKKRRAPEILTWI